MLFFVAVLVVVAVVASVTGVVDGGAVAITSVAGVVAIAVDVVSFAVVLTWYQMAVLTTKFFC